MKIATWNVNSVKVRLPNLLRWLGEFAPDVVLLQELKCVTEAFPEIEVGDAGYNVAVAGQKTYNGVAILSKSPIDVELTELPGDPSDEQARYIEAFTGGLRVASIYLPNGNPVDSDKFPYKLGFMERLHAHAAGLLATEDAFVLGGDYNAIPEPGDAYDPQAVAEDAIYRPETRAAWRKIVYLGLTDAFRALNTEIGLYSYWDYQRGAWQKDNGFRIDHLLLSPQAADRLTGSGIDRGPRGWEKPSDHTPVWCELDI
ncbi:MAG: exodeoxyribonuclease III [Rhodospirillales bacterium]|jgi:exodeoxyribonuclease-3|nr:exodeoxyribonuclease III [Rhodospirillaceae bacterium]MDP6428274.1 exodeoxyribonuclease III [Rhodospirillales bacterium]MDP6646139.1 exodeoxyribonuclease III [Rhodospirillales bacterium]MDP6840688.1 exodeoxyribonuclease III [Rhodospirillales bacterium]